MQRSVLEAIREGEWDFEPIEFTPETHHATGALPGSQEKLAILAERAERGLPLWHDGDRRSFDDALRD